MRVCLCVCLCVCLYLCLWECVCVFIVSTMIGSTPQDVLMTFAWVFFYVVKMCVCMYVYVYVYVCVCARTFVCVCACLYSPHTHVCLCVCVCVFTANGQECTTNCTRGFLMSVLLRKKGVCQYELVCVCVCAKARERESVDYSTSPLYVCIYAYI